MARVTCITKMSEPKYTFTFTGTSYDVDDFLPIVPDSEESLEPNGVIGDELLGEYVVESSPVDWLEPLDRFVVLVDPCVLSQPFDGRGGTGVTADNGTYAVGWLALRARLRGVTGGSIDKGEVALLDSPLSCGGRSREELY
jgi:hypothetical protein